MTTNLTDRQNTKAKSARDKANAALGTSMDAKTVPVLSRNLVIIAACVREAMEDNSAGISSLAKKIARRIISNADQQAEFLAMCGVVGEPPA